MIKQMSQLTSTIGEKVFHFSCEHDATMDHIKHALFNFTKYIGQVEDQVKAFQEKQKQSEEIKENISNEQTVVE